MRKKSDDGFHRGPCLSLFPNWWLHCPLVLKGKFSFDLVGQCYDTAVVANKKGLYTVVECTRTSLLFSFGHTQQTPSSMDMVPSLSSCMREAQDCSLYLASHHVHLVSSCNDQFFCVKILTTAELMQQQLQSPQLIL